MEPYLGQILLWPVPWVPDGWTLCNGALLPINQNSALFALIGTTYGGDGVNTFAVPDLRSRVPMGSQSMNAVGAVSGSPSSTVTATGAGALSIGVANLPVQNFSATLTATASVSIPADSATDTDSVPGPTLVLAKAAAGVAASKIYSSNAPNTTLKPFTAPVTGTVAVTSTGAAGTALPVTVSVPVTVSTVQPSLTMNYIIALQGIFPSRP
jgi:microcystin-dependent protein